MANSLYIAAYTYTEYDTNKNVIFMDYEGEGFTGSVTLTRKQAKALRESLDLAIKESK